MVVGELFIIDHFKGCIVILKAIHFHQAANCEWTVGIGAVYPVWVFTSTTSLVNPHKAIF